MRARRRIRRLGETWGRMALAAIVVLLALSGGCGGDDGPGEGTVKGTGSAPMDAAGWGRCGDPVPQELGEDGGLALSAAFPGQVSSAGQDRVEGTATVTNRGDRNFSGVAAGEAAVYVTRAGRIVATPFDQEDRGLLLDLPPGATQAVPAVGRLRHCSDGASPLEPGGYEVYAVLSVTEGSGDRTLRLSAGPSPLTVA